MFKFFFSAIIAIILSCNGGSTETEDNELVDHQDEMEEVIDIISQDSQAVVVNVSFAGSTNDYNFSVELKSPDTGCNQYADWWEIIDEEEQLIYRRILTHSHVEEQPFIRSGSPVSIQDNKKIFIRGHMNNLGYGTLVFSGTVDEGFTKDTLDINFAAELEKEQPLPTRCEF